MANNKPKLKFKKIKDYVILDIIGKGGMGEVYLAKHPTLKRGIILKRLTIKDKESSERFLKEAQVMLEFRHENIVQIYDHFKEGSSTYIAMEYVKGKPLNEVIQQNNKIPVPLALFMLYQVALGLYHAHSKKVIHRDIKPHNILISTDGEVKLTDFGIAKTSDDSKADITSPGTVIGTPAYMSPEQFSDSSVISYQSDIYSLGVVFYEMLTGLKPYKNEFTPEVLTCIAKGKCTPATKLISDLPPIAKKILKKTFNPKLSRRYKSLYHLIKLLRKYFKKFNVYEVRASVKRLLIKDKKILQSPFLVSYKRQKIRNIVFSSLIYGILAIGILTGLFIYTNRYYEWIVPGKYGKILMEFESANLDTENIIIGVDGKYQKAFFKKNRKLVKIKDKNKKSKFAIKTEIDKNFKKYFYVTEGEHEFSVVSGSYKNTKKVIVSPRTLQKKSKKTSKGQNVNIYIGALQPKEVLLFFRFWDAITNKRLFNFDHYSENYLRNLYKEEDSLKIYYFNAKRYMKLKDYILLRYKYRRDPFSSDTSYFFMVDGFKTDNISYETKKFNIKFALDDRTVYIHTPLTPKPSKITIISDIKNLPLIINNENQGLIYNKGQYNYEKYQDINYKRLKNKKYYCELLIPPGTISFKISSKGKLIKKFLKSDEVLKLEVTKDHGKFVY